MNNVCNIPLIFICVHNAILCFLSYHVPMFSLLMINQSISNNINLAKYYGQYPINLVFIPGNCLVHERKMH